MKTKILKLASLLGAAALVASFSGPAAAGSATANLNVTATVASGCSIATTAVAFGTYDPIVANATTPINTAGNVQVTCVSGSTSVWVGLGQGNNYSAGRRMVGGTSGAFLNYHLYLPPTAVPAAACTYSGTEWGTTNGTDTLNPADAVWDGTTKTFNVCGVLTAGQVVPADSYSDVVVATVNF